MTFTKGFTSVIFSIFIACSSQAQYTDTAKAFSPEFDSTTLKVAWQNVQSKNIFSVKSLLIPGIMIAYGFTSLENDGFKNLNQKVNNEMWVERPHKVKRIDNLLQFAPAITVYGLNAIGIKGKHSFRDRSMIYLISNIIMNTTVFSVKKLSHQQRPDGSDYFSFPSGHTAEAFASAEFLRQEYKDVSPWYGVAGYAMAATTGYLRMYNNKHWLSDVVAAAGVGIASTKIAYWLYPKFQHKLFKDKPVKTVVMPTYQNGAFGVGMVHRF